jgi:hypothetical protein
VEVLYSIFGSGAWVPEEIRDSLPVPPRSSRRSHDRPRQKRPLQKSEISPHSCEVVPPPGPPRWCHGKRRARLYSTAGGKEWAVTISPIDILDLARAPYGNEHVLVEDRFPPKSSVQLITYEMPGFRSDLACRLAQPRRMSFAQEREKGVVIEDDQFLTPENGCGKSCEKNQIDRRNQRVWPRL